MHISKAGGSFFSLLLPRMLQEIIPNMTVNMIEHTYPETKGHPYFTAFNQSVLLEADVFSREKNGAKNLWDLHTNLSTSSNVFSLFLARRPDARPCLHMIHSIIRNAHSVRIIQRNS
jgi:hypothetical protein